MIYSSYFYVNSVAWMLGTLSAYLLAEMCFCSLVVTGYFSSLFFLFDLLTTLSVIADFINTKSYLINDDLILYMTHRLPALRTSRLAKLIISVGRLVTSQLGKVL